MGQAAPALTPPSRSRIPRGESATIIVAARGQPLAARAVSSLLDRSQRLLDDSIEIAGPDGSRCLMVISPFLGPAAKERLADAGISYADATGNMCFVTDRPAVFIETEGAVCNPWRENVPLQSLQGRRSARVVRAWSRVFSKAWASPTDWA